MFTDRKDLKESIRYKMNNIKRQTVNIKIKTLQTKECLKQISTFVKNVNQKAKKDFLLIKDALRQKSKCSESKINCTQDKQNNQNIANQSTNSKTMIKSYRKKNKNLLQVKRFQTQFQEKDLIYKNNDIKIINATINTDLKNRILTELTQLKLLEKRGDIIRKTNQRIRSYNSEHKRSLEEVKKEKKFRSKMNKNYFKHSLIASSSSSACCLNIHDGIHSSEQSFKKSFNQNINTSKNILQSKIEVVIGGTKRSHLTDIIIQRTLKCPFNHDYYFGETRGAEAHGNGKVFYCCQKIPIKISQDVQYYNGSFKNGEIDGFGTISYRGGVKYVGSFLKGSRHGRGSLYYEGKVELGEWVHDQLFKLI